MNRFAPRPRMIAIVQETNSREPCRLFGSWLRTEDGVGRMIAACRYHAAPRYPCGFAGIRGDASCRPFVEPGIVSGKSGLFARPVLYFLMGPFVFSMKNKFIIKVLMDINYNYQ